MPEILVDAFLAKIREKILSGEERATGREKTMWQGAMAVFESLAANRDSLESFGIDQFSQLVRSVRDAPNIHAAIIQTMDAQSLIADMQAGAGELRADTEAQAQTRAKIQQMLVDLGRLGLNILVSLI